MRILELATELGVDARELLADINAADLGVTFDNPMSQLTPAEVSLVKRSRGIVDHPLLGTWRLLALTHGDHTVITGQSHLVVTEDAIWEVWPDQVRYVGDPEPWLMYELEWEIGATDGRLVIHGAHFKRHSIVRKVGDEMHLRAGGVAGHPPSSFRDTHGTLATYELETDPDVLAGLDEPPAALTRTQVSHPTIGELTYDENLNWWTARTAWHDTQITFHADGGPNDDASHFDRSAEILAALQPRSIKYAAANRLIENHNENWCDEGEEVDAEGFMARMEVASITVESTGRVIIYFDDGDLFYGHSIYVTLNENLEPIDAGIAG